MFDFLSKFSNSSKKFTGAQGKLKELYTFKVKLIEEVNTLKKEKTSLSRTVSKKKKESETFIDLSAKLKEMKKEKRDLEYDLALLYKAKKFTLDIKELEKQKIALKSQIEQLKQNKLKIEKDISNLKENKALLIDKIEQVNSLTPKFSTEFSIEKVDALQTGLDFENYFAILLDKLGFYDIKVTEGSGDFGIDVLAYSDDILYGFQCKLYSSAVGNKAIQEAYSGKTHYNCNIAVVVTNNYFTEQARKQAKETNVLLWDRSILVKKLNEAQKHNFTISFK